MSFFFSSRIIPLIAVAYTVAMAFGTPVVAEEITVSSLKLERDIQLEKLNLPLATFQEKYEAGLSRLKTEVQKSGDLDQALAITEELENYKTPGRKVSADYSDLAKLQTIYFEGSRPLVEAQFEARSSVIEKYDSQLALLETSLTRNGKLEEAVKVRTEREAAAQLLSDLEAGKAKGEGILFEDDFNGPLDSERWTASNDIQFSDGFAFVNSYSEGTRLEIKKEFTGDFRIDIELERDGDEVWKNWGFAVKFSALTPVAALRLGRDDINLLYVDSAADQSGRPGKPGDDGTIQVTQRVRKSQGGTLSVWVKAGEFHASFTDEKGKEMTCEPISVPDFEKSNITIRFGGTPDTPRKITRVKVTQV